MQLSRGPPKGRNSASLIALKVIFRRGKSENLRRTLKCPRADSGNHRFLVPRSSRHTVSLFAAVLLTCSYSRVTQAAQLAMHAEAVCSPLLFLRGFRLMPGNYPRVFAPTGSDRLRAVRLLCSLLRFCSSNARCGSFPSSMGEVPPSGCTSGKQTPLYGGNRKATCCVTITCVVMGGYVLPT